jgi:hypothetical protein
MRAVSPLLRTKQVGEIWQGEDADQDESARQSHFDPCLHAQGLDHNPSEQCDRVQHFVC